MRFWLQYHNRDKLGRWPDGFDAGGATSPELFDTSRLSVDRGIFTRKPIVCDAIGDVVFLVVGYGGKSRKYVLWDWFLIENVEEDEDGFFVASGTGRALNPPPAMSGPEFEAFKKQNANFSLGFQEISKRPYLARLVALARERGHFDLLDTFVQAINSIPEEVRNVRELVEGAVRVVTVNAFERNPEARRLCIAHYGCTCAVCDSNLAAVYGLAADGIIHVHHLRPLSEIGEKYKVDPIADLRPVCPNCHAVIHARTPAYSIAEVQRFLQEARH